jgi:hypothetical protein
MIFLYTVCDLHRTGRECVGEGGEGGQPGVGWRGEGGYVGRGKVEGRGGGKHY